MDLVERESVLQSLRAQLDGAAVNGRVALVTGEAGIGKTSVLRAFAGARPQDTVWWGACDALQTPHPLAPLLDIARARRPRFAAALDGPRAALFEAVLDELRLAAEPVLVVVEDAHWADDATLDWLKHLGRRIEGTRALLAISYRDDEVTATHPLRRVLGELPPSARTLIQVPRLTPAAVETLARRAGRRADGWHAATRGNAFFVTEVLRDASDPRPAVPASVQDVVLARFARLPAGAQALLQAVSVVPGRAERVLIDRVAAPALADVEAALGSGLLLAEGEYFAFRHELGRVAVETALSAPAAQALHARVLAALTECAAAPARLVHHALRARNTVALSRWAPIAAREAAARSAHREAAAHWRAALENAQPADDAERREWLAASAFEHSLIGRHDIGTEARCELERLARDRGDLLEAANQISLRMVHLVSVLRFDEATRLNRAAIALIEHLDPGPVHAYVWLQEAWLRWSDRDAEAGVAWAQRALAVAQPLDDRWLTLSIQSMLGSALLFVRYEEGAALMQQVQAEQRAAGMVQAAALTLGRLGVGSLELMQLADAERASGESLSLSVAHEFDNHADACRAWLSRTALLRGRWIETAELAAAVLESPGVCEYSRMLTLVTLARLRTRRGDPGAQAALDEALALAGEQNMLGCSAPLRAARAEVALARGDAAAAAAEVAAALPLAAARRHPWLLGDLAYHGWRAGSLAAAPPGCAEPFALEIAGRWREAAEAWQALDCPYERARALAAADDAGALLEALAIFDRLGARPAAEALRERLRRAGVPGVPGAARGARASTRERPFGLTARELQVLQLLCEGLRNAEIAARVHRSVRTVDHHLAAVFAKLGVDSRVGAIQAAQRAGIVAQSGQSAASI